MTEIGLGWFQLLLFPPDSVAQAQKKDDPLRGSLDELVLYGRSMDRTRLLFGGSSDDQVGDAILVPGTASDDDGIGDGCPVAKSSVYRAAPVTLSHVSLRGTLAPRDPSMALPSCRIRCRHSL